MNLPNTTPTPEAQFPSPESAKTESPAKSLVFAQSVTLKSPNDDKTLADLSTPELAEALAQRLAITSDNWHRLKANRKARAAEQAAIALAYLINDHSEEALARFHQTVGWLDRSVSAPPCPTHGK